MHDVEKSHRSWSRLAFPVLNSARQLMDQLISFSAANLIHYNFLSCLLFLFSFLLCCLFMQACERAVMS